MGPIAIISEGIRTWYENRVTVRNFVGQVLRKMRRFYLGTFRPEYIQKAIEENRQGECHRCGLCCELVYKCPFLGRDSKNLAYCRVYGELRPANCKNYPFDIRDAEIDRCGYSFKNSPKKEKALPKLGKSPALPAATPPPPSQPPVLQPSMTYRENHAVKGIQTTPQVDGV